ncbi:MAG: hypothetical protein ACRC9P_05720, partial [Bacteroides sp.]
MKLELKHLAPYMPYGLRVEYRGEVTTLDALDIEGGAFVGENRMVSFVNLKYIKPILRPLSDVTEAEARSFLKLAHGGLINSTEINIDTIDKDALYLSSELSDGTIVCLRANHTL